MTRALTMAFVLALVAGAGWMGFSVASREAGAPPILWTVPDFTLMDDQDRPVRRADLAGKPWVAAFIYASCSTQCPMMTAKMKTLRAGLPEATLVSFSVDGTDTPERLAAFKKTYGADWMFLTGKAGEVEELCRTGFKLPVANGVHPSDPIIHSDRLVLIDRASRVRAFFTPSDPVQLADLGQALKAL